MPVSEKLIPTLEKQIPELASGAVKQAYARALASGSSVLEAKNGKLVESRPDGTVRVIKTLPAGKTVSLGKRRIINR